eukprot:1143432-Pelagomonas_calceolata.AAC.1
MSQSNRVIRQLSLEWHQVLFKDYKGYKGKRSHSRHLTASLFVDAHEVMKEKRKFVVIMVWKDINILGVHMMHGTQTGHPVGDVEM